MRNAFAREITSLAQEDERIVLLSADIGNRLFDDFKTHCPGRFFNCGVAEANMIGVASGMAMTGLRPVCYTITNFVTYRCLEQIRVDVCYHHQPVIIVGTGSGLSYASLGGTHHSLEEMGMLRLLPGLAIVAPADPLETAAALRAAFEWGGPLYMRIGKKGEPAVHPSMPDFHVGKSIQVKDGTDVCILSSGTMLPVAVEAAGLLQTHGCSARVESFHTIKPLDEAALSDAFHAFKVVATVEEHSVLGGLGGAVAEWRADHPEGRGILVRFGTRDEFLHQTCDQHSAREFFGLTPPSLAKKICERWESS